MEKYAMVLQLSQSKQYDLRKNEKKYCQTKKS